MTPYQSTTRPLLNNEQSMIVYDNGMGKVPKKRGHIVWIVTLLFGIVFSVIYIAWLVTDAQTESAESKKSNNTEEHKDTLPIIFEELSLFLIAMVAAIIIIYFTRTINFVVEGVRFFETRYNRSWRRLALHTLTIGRWGDLSGIVFLVISVIFLIVFFSSGVEDDVKKTMNVVLGAVGLTQMFTTLTKLNDQTKAQLSEIVESEKVNLATGMAWSYFTGYIELILTDSPDHSNLSKAIHKYGLKPLLASTKLYLMIPKDCIVQRVLTNLGDDNIKCMGKFLSRTCNRAGVEGRQYWTTMYQIKQTVDGNARYYYGCFEYITPIDTFDQMKKRKIIKEDHFMDQVKLFINVFSDILEEHTSRNGDCVRLLTYDPKMLGPGGLSGFIVDAMSKAEGSNLQSFDEEQTFPAPDEGNKSEYKLL